MSFQTVTMTLLDGFLLNIELFAVTLVLSLPLGLVVSFGTMSRFKPLSLLVRLYVYIMRSTPLMLQLAVVFYLPGIVFGPGPVSYTHLSETPALTMLESMKSITRYWPP